MIKYSRTPRLHQTEHKTAHLDQPIDGITQKSPRAPPAGRPPHPAAPNRLPPRSNPTHRPAPTHRPRPVQEGASLVQTVESLAGYDIYLGVHGAQLTNTIYGAQGLVLVEFADNTKDNVRV